MFVLALSVSVSWFTVHRTVRLPQLHRPRPLCPTCIALDPSLDDLTDNVAAKKVSLELPELLVVADDERIEELPAVVELPPVQDFIVDFPGERDHVQDTIQDFIVEGFPTELPAAPPADAPVDLTDDEDIPTARHLVEVPVPTEPGADAAQQDAAKQVSVLPSMGELGRFCLPTHSLSPRMHSKAST